MAYTPEFSTETAIYRLFHTNHNRITREDIINPKRISRLDGIILEVTGDKIIQSPPENTLKMYDHSGVVEIVRSLGEDGPPIYVVDVHMDNILKDTWPDFVTWLIGGGLTISGINDLRKLSKGNSTRRRFFRLFSGLGKIAAGGPLGTYDKLTMIALMHCRGEIDDWNPLKWHYGDLIVPDMVIGRDAIYARKLEEGVVPLARNDPSRKVELDIHCGAGHTRMPKYIGDKKLRDELLDKYAEHSFSDFDKEHLNKIYVLKYDPNEQKWKKKEHNVRLF